MTQQNKISIQCSRQEGFSLVEVLVVVAIFAVVAAIATPNALRYRENSRLRAAASEVLSIFRNAQVHAVKRDYNACIEIDPAAGTVMSFSDDGSGGGTTNDSTHNGDEPIIASFSVPPNVFIPGASVTFPGNQTCFTPAGLPSGTGMMDIRSASGAVPAEYRISLTIAGHTALLVSTDGGATWQ